MSKHNYSQYSTKKKGENDNIKTTPAKTSAPEIKMVVETVDTVVLPKTVEGVVVDCAKLNVRAEPSIDADIVCAIDVMSEIKIDVNESNNEWFKIHTAAGIEGYCMRKFVDAHL